MRCIPFYIIIDLMVSELLTPTTFGPLKLVDTKKYMLNGFSIGGSCIIPVMFSHNWCAYTILTIHSCLTSLYIS